jgi:hypothetical protein
MEPLDEFVHALWAGDFDKVFEPESELFWGYPSTLRIAWPITSGSRKALMIGSKMESY